MGRSSGVIFLLSGGGVVLQDPQVAQRRRSHALRYQHQYPQGSRASRMGAEELEAWPGVQEGAFSLWEQLLVS